MTAHFDELKSRYLAGEPLAALAASTGLSVVTLLRELRAAGVPSRTRTLRERALAELPELIAAGATASDLAQRYGVHDNTIHRWAASIDVSATPRPPRQRASVPEEIVARYRDREPLSQLAEELGITVGALKARLRSNGITRPRAKNPRPTCPDCGQTCSGRSVTLCSACRRKYPKPTSRPCENCGTVFIPKAGKRERGAGGRFCQYECWNEWRTGKPQRDWRG